MDFNQWSDTGNINHTLERVPSQEQLTNTKWIAWIFTPVFCFVSILFVFYLINFFLFYFFVCFDFVAVVPECEWGVAFSFWGERENMKLSGYRGREDLWGVRGGKRTWSNTLHENFSIKNAFKVWSVMGWEAVSWQDVGTSPWVQYSAWTGHGDTQINPVFKRPKNLRSVA